MNQLTARLLDAADEHILRVIPARLVSGLRLRICRLLGAEVGARVTLGTGVHLVGKSGLCIGDGVSIARDSTLDGRGGLKIQDSALIGFESIILTSTHNSTRIGVPIQSQGMFRKSTVVGRRAWLGARVIVQPGVSIGDDSIIGSGSVVTKPIAGSTIAAGVPARVLRTRLDRNA